MYFLFCLLGVVPSIIIASPVLGGFSSDDVILDSTDFQQVYADNVELDWLDWNGPTQNIFANEDAKVDSGFLSSDVLGTYSNGVNPDTPLVESDPTLLWGDLGSLAFSDISSPDIPINQAGSNYEESPVDSNLFANIVTVVAPSPACSSLDRGATGREFQPLCCNPPCQNEQSWRKSCGRCSDFPRPWFRVGLLNYMFRGY